MTKRNFLKKFNILLFFLFVFLISSSTVFSKNRPNEILIFAGAGMRVPLLEIGNVFEKDHGIKVIYDFAGSGRLGNKILVGQKPDLFIPGSDRWAKILIKKGYIENYQPIAYHTPVIITPKGNTGINSLKDFMIPENKVALSDSKAAALGSICSAIFKKSGTEESSINIRARGVTVKQLVFWVEGNNVDGSIVWRADAIQSGKVRIVSIPDEYNVTNIIPLCKIDKNDAAVNEFVTYLMGPEGMKCFEKHGFKTVSR